MAEIASFTPLAPEGPKPKEFSLNVEIGGLPYIFRGDLPQKTPSGFFWSIHMPNWQEELPKINQLVKEGKLPIGGEIDLFRRREGMVGYMSIDHTSDGRADLYISRIKSHTWIASKDSPYYDARGVGRFLMNNLLTLADLNGWSITAFPYTNGRLTNEDVFQWFQRKGFDFEKGELVRKPQKPDMTQAITQVLSPSPK